MTTRIQLRRGTAAQWTSADPVLALGEAGIETDTLLWKVGDGTTVWSELPYMESANETFGNVNVTGDVSATGNITGNYLFGNGSQLTDLPLATNSTPGVVALGNGFALNSSNQVTTSSLYNTNLTQPTQHYALRVDTNGVVVLPDQSIINGSTLRAVAGSYAGLTTDDGENSWMWVDSSGAYIATQYNESGNSHQWTFDNTGNLTLPANTFAVNYANGDPVTFSGNSGNANTGDVTFSNQTVIGTGDQYGGSGLYLAPGTESVGNLQYLRVRGGDYPTHIHLDTGNNQYFDQYFGDDSKYVKLANTGNIVIRTDDFLGNGAQWTFGANGGTIFPTLNVQRGDNPSGTIQGQTLLFGDATQEAIITTPNGVAGNEYSQRLVINPGAGYDYGEGGDIYLWAGRGGDNNGSGGDVKIRGGQGMGESGSGGYIRMEGGDSQDRGYPGYINITAGYGANTYGAYVNITGGGGGNGQGGPVQIQGGYGSTGFKGGDANIIGGPSANGIAEYGNVNIGSGASTWSFDNAGNLTLPSNSSSINYANGQPYGSTGGSANIIYNGLSNVSIPVANSDVVINTINPNISVNAILNASYGLSAGTYINQPTTALTGVGVGMTVDYTVLVGNDGIDSVSINHPGTGYADGDQITIPVGIPVSGAIFDIAVGAPFTETWTFGQTGELYTPQGGRLGYAGKGWLGLDGGYGAPVSVTSYYANGFYAGCVSAYPDGNVGISTYTGSSSYSWNFDNTGALNLPISLGGPFGGFAGVIQTANAYPTLLAYGLGSHGGPELDWTNSDDPANTFGSSDTVRNTLYLNGEAGLYVGFNENGNVGPYTGHFQVDTLGNVQIPAQNVGASTPNGTPGEATYLRGTRKAINGVYSGATNPFAVEIVAGPASTVAYTATNSNVQSVKITFAVQSTGNGSCWEQFDVVATPNQDTPGTVNYVVSNRIKSTSAVTDTQVTATLNVGGQIEISLTPMSGQNGWASFDAVEFGLMVD